MFPRLGGGTPSDVSAGQSWSQPSAPALSVHTGALTVGGGSQQASRASTTSFAEMGGTGTLVSFKVIVTVLDLCGASVVSSKDKLGRVCVCGAGCKIHKAAVGESVLSPDLVYLLAPMSNNKRTVLESPTLPFNLFERDGLDFLETLPPRPYSDAVNLITLWMDGGTRNDGSNQLPWGRINLEASIVDYHKGVFDSLLSDIGSPRGTSGNPFDFTSRSYQASVEESKEAVEEIKIEELDVEGPELTEAGKFSEFETALYDEVENSTLAESGYDPEQMKAVFKRLQELTQYSTLAKLRFMRIAEDRGLTISGGLSKIDSLAGSMVALEQQLGWDTLLDPVLPGCTIRQQIHILHETVSALQQTVDDIGRSGMHAQWTELRRDVLAMQNDYRELKARVDKMEECFTDPSQLPKVFDLVTGMATVINGGSYGASGSNLQAKLNALKGDIMQEVGVAGGDAAVSAGASSNIGFQGLSLGGNRGAAPRAGRTVVPSTQSQNDPATDYRLSALESELATMRSNLAGMYTGPGMNTMAFAGGASGPSVETVDILERLRNLETKSSKDSVTMGSHTFTCLEDVQAFVSKHVPNPNFGLLSDMVIILQKLKTTTETTKSVLDTHNGAKKLQLDVIEANILISFAMLLPSILDRSGEAVSSSNVHAIPAIKKYSEWTNTLIGLRAKIQKEISNETKSIQQRINDSKNSADAKGVFNAMLLSSTTEWKQTEQYVDTQMQVLTAEYNLPEAEAWTLMSKGLREVFVYLRSLRAIAQDLLSDSSTKAEQFALAMWACLRCHKAMEEYQACSYIGHYTLASVRAEHLLTQRVSPNDLKVLVDKMSTLQGSMTGLATDVDALLVHTKVTSKRKRKI